MVVEDISDALEDVSRDLVKEKLQDTKGEFICT